MPTTGLERAGKFLPILLELCLVVAVVYLFNIEIRRHFLPVLSLIVCGFSIHTWLPHERRLAFFGVLSVASVLFVLGIANGMWVLGIGGLLIGICYLPITYQWRVMMLVIAGAALVFSRSAHPLTFWPVVGSMFMFRLITFVHEIRHEKAPPPLAWVVSYFFLLPNACFPLFPIVEYKTFRMTRYDSNEWEIYQRGVHWIVRGLIHLLLYRFIKAYMVPEAYELHDIRQIAVFAATNYALYLQVSGQFHLVTGLLHLFGFNLPPTHHLYFLASSFSDIWRRINIYWKDFLTKYVFFPAFYALRQRGASVNPAIVASVFLVFVSTWFFHSWQTFWLLGRFPVTINDACLWLGAGSLVAVNAVFDARRRPRTSQPAWQVSLNTSARIVGMFVLVSLFWSCWTKPGFLTLIASSLNRPSALRGVLTILMWLLIAVATGVIAVSIQNWRTKNAKGGSPLDFSSSVKLHLAALCVVIALASPGSSGMLGIESAMAIGEFRADPTIARDAGEKLQSYYEDLNMTTIQAGPMLSSLTLDDGTRRAQAEGFLKVSRRADLYQGLELIPGIETELDGNSFTVNLFGMRDRKTVRLDKPDDVTRIAMVGSSIVMGYGVSDDDVFARQFEKRLNEMPVNQHRRFEVLNFGVGKQWAMHRLIRIQRKVMAFDPDALYYFAHQDEFKEVASHVAQLISNRRELPSRHLKDVADKAKTKAESPPGEIVSRLGRFEPELLNAIYRTIVDECASRNIIPVWIYLPIPGPDANDFKEKLIPIASSAGFVVCDLTGWSNDQEGLFPTTEYHPNARGHQLIADALMRMVKDVPEALPARVRVGPPH